MFIRLFKSNSVVSLVTLPLLAALIWLFGFVHPQVFPAEHSMPLYELIANALAPFPGLSVFISFALIVGEAFLLNYIITQNGVLPKQSYLTALFYVVFMSNNPEMLLLHPLVFANLFVLLAFEKLISSYRKDVAFSESFDAGILLSIAALFYLPCAVLFPLLGVAFIIFRPFNWREWLISFFGVLMPLCFVVSYYFWFNALNDFWFDKIVLTVVSKQAKVLVPGSFYFMIITGWLIIFFALITTLGGLTSGSQKSKKTMIFFIWLALFGGASVLIAPEISTKYFSIVAIPTSVFCANYFTTQKKEWYGELLFLLLLGALFFNLFARFL